MCGYSPAFTGHATQCDECIGSEDSHRDKILELNVKGSEVTRSMFVLFYRQVSEAQSDAEDEWCKCVITTFWLNGKFLVIVIISCNLY